jgi:hypothetical protein
MVRNFTLAQLAGVAGRLVHGKRSVFRGILATGLVAGLGAGAIAYAHDHDDGRPPTEGQIAFAQRTSDLLLNTLFAALTQEFDETTPDNVEEGKTSISVVFNDANKDMRLVGTLDPIRDNDRPHDSFEQNALERALAGGQATTAVQRVDDRWYYRRSIPLSNFRDACSLCHTNFGPTNAAQWVGALMLRVPIRR